LQTEGGPGGERGKKKAYELTDMIDDMMAVLDAMGWDSANLAGLSMGGALAQFAALLRSW